MLQIAELFHTWTGLSYMKMLMEQEEILPMYLLDGTRRSLQWNLKGESDEEKKLGKAP